MIRMRIKDAVPAQKGRYGQKLVTPDQAAA